MGADLQEERGVFSGFGFVGEEADGAAGMEAVEDACAGAGRRPQAVVADGYATVSTDAQDGAQAPDVGPPGAARSRAQHAAFFALDLVDVAVTAQVGQEALPVLVLAFVY